MSEIVLRLYVEAPDDAGGEKVADLILDRVTDKKLLFRAVRPYHKVPEYREVLLRFEAPLGAPQIDPIATQLGAGWTDTGDPDEPAKIWNRGGVATFFSPLVTWASLEWVNG